MRKVVIFGAGDRGKQFVHMSENADIKKTFGDYEIEYFVDNNPWKWDTYLLGKKIKKPSELCDMKEIDAVFIGTPGNVDAMMKQLLELNITVPVYMIPEYVFNFKWGDDMPVFIRMDISKPRIPVLEYLIVDHCILKCKGCLTASNIRPPHFDTLENFEKHMQQIKKIFSGVGSLRLLGGELFLHKNVVDFIVSARRFFPDAGLIIITNGLLIPSLAEEVLRTLSRLDVLVSISEYRVTGEMKREIEEILGRNGVKYWWRGAVYSFRKSININGTYNADDVFKRCARNPSVVNGVLSCEKYTELQLLRQVYNVDLGGWDNDLGINIFTTEMNGWEINDYLSKPSKLCSYCATYSGDPNVEFPWKCNHTDAELDDWIYK